MNHSFSRWTSLDDEKMHFHSMKTENRQHQTTHIIILLLLMCHIYHALMAYHVIKIPPFFKKSLNDDKIF